MNRNGAGKQNFLLLDSRAALLLAKQPMRDGVCAGRQADNVEPNPAPAPSVIPVHKRQLFSDCCRCRHSLFSPFSSLGQILPQASQGIANAPDAASNSDERRPLARQEEKPRMI